MPAVTTVGTPRLADVGDAAEVARLLHDFNIEFDTPSPGSAVLRERLATLLAGPSLFALLHGAPAVAVAVVSLRPNVWHPGPVALLEELYVAPDHRDRGIGSSLLALLRGLVVSRGCGAIEINVDEGDVDAQRFYERHGYTRIQPDTGEQAYYYSQELPQ